ncbi:o-succinylbenzoate synthase [Galbitalea sp. SE-J8]|uniref:o-succinylbenzoate synthase n=1 Tax=Galbitalea sp. SE-J8 TaxID=3054952 RepID=UPI00259CF99C|nr:o-succinylbenzoate synthase [Galbitalea sp. SE-J8]MDM4762397.1 o-succinylbenzoate synthase [Galbitalea sp. SE-J8]
MIPSLDELLDGARIVSIPLRRRFRGIDVREALLVEGPHGWTEFSPFLEYDDAEAAHWLRAAVEAGWSAAPPALRERIRVNATLPVVDPGDVGAVLARFPGCRTVKVKVADPGTTLTDDVARVRATRAALGPEGRIRVDANAAWTVDEAEHALRALSTADLEYAEQPCATIGELAELRERIADLAIPIAADESVRKAEDPLEVARAGAADLLVVKVQPLGGARRVLDLVERTGLPVVVSSALETSVGIAAGVRLAAALPALEFDCGLATVALLTDDVARHPLVPIDGALPVGAVEVDPAALDRLRAAPEREAHWRARLSRCYGLAFGAATVTT